MKIENDGRVQIGTQKPTVNDYKLAVDGRIVCKDLQMTMLNWRDDVFSEKYNLKSIEEVEIYIKKNKYLPAFPPENEIIENGMNVKQIFLAQQATLEEMMLYIIDLEKRMKLMENIK